MTDEAAPITPPVPWEYFKAKPNDEHSPWMVKIGGSNGLIPIAFNADDKQDELLARRIVASVNSTLAHPIEIVENIAAESWDSMRAADFQRLMRLALVVRRVVDDSGWLGNELQEALVDVEEAFESDLEEAEQAAR